MFKVKCYDPYVDNLRKISAGSCLVSGNCNRVKWMIASDLIARSLVANTSTVVIDFTRNSFVDEVIRSVNCHVTEYDPENHTFGYDTFSGYDIRTSIQMIKTKAESLGYAHQESIQLIKYIKLLDMISERLGLRFSHIRELIAYFSDMDKVSEAIQHGLYSHKIRSDEVQGIYTDISRSARGNIVLENIVEEIDFNTNNNNSNSFSIRNMPQGTVAHVYATSAFDNEIQTLLESLAYDLAYIEPVNVIINSGCTKLADRANTIVDHLVSTRSKNLLYLCDDVFTKDNNLHFISYFDVIAYGRHIGNSAISLSNSFGTRRTIETHESESRDKRITHNSFLDTLLDRNVNEGIQYVPVELPRFRADTISSLRDDQAICVFKTGAIQTMTF